MSAKPSVSEFYYACRNGDEARVKTLLESMSSSDIDRMEPNGSSALHAAAYFGHTDVVRLLLDHGASRNQKNKYNKTPEEEAKTPEIVQLFQKTSTFTPHTTSLINDMFSATSHHRRFYSFGQGPPTLSEVVQKLLNAEELQSDNHNMELVNGLFRKAIERNDATLLICAYTMESCFYRELKKATANHGKLSKEERENPPWFCAYSRFLASDEPTLRPYRWTGTTYRGERLREEDVAQYKLGCVIMNKTFLSTTKSRAAAERFVNGSNNDQLSQVIITYIVNDDRAAFDISHVSKYPAEEEVLILPCMDFEVTKIDLSGKFAEITLFLR